MGFGSKHGHWDGIDINHDTSSGRICDNFHNVRLRVHLTPKLRIVTWASIELSAKSVHFHGRPQGGARGGHLPPLEFEKMTSYAAVLRNTLNFSLAPSALALDTLYVSLKRRKNAKIFVCAFGAPKNG